MDCAEFILATTCRLMGVSPDAVRANGRFPRVVATRWIAAALIPRHANMTYPQIAVAMWRGYGRTDTPSHSSVIDMCRKFRSRMNASGSLRVGNYEVHGCDEVAKAVTWEWDQVNGGDAP